MSHTPSLPSLETTWPLSALERLERVAPFVIGGLLFLLPLLFPLGIGRDYPNHLARVYIQTALDDVPQLAGNYRLDWFLVPDLALDLFALPLAGWLSSYTIGALFNGLMLLLLFSATLALHRSVGGKGSAWPLLATAVLFNEALRWGFVNFLFACGLALWLVCFWLRTAEWPALRRLALFAPLQIALFFAHLLGFMLCGYLILTLELVRFWQHRDQPSARRAGSFLAAMLQFAVPVALFGIVLFGQSGVGDDTTLYGGLGTKALAFLSPISALASPVSLLILLLILLLLYAVLRHGLGTLDRKLLPLIAALAGLLVAMPNMVLGIWGLDFRYPFIALLVTIAAVRLRPQARGAGYARALAFAIAVAALAGAGWQFADTHRKQDELRRALALAAPGGALLVAGDYEVDCPRCFPTWIDQLHVGSLAAIERQMFVPLLFSATSFVSASPGRHDLDVPHGMPVSRRALIDGRGRPLPRRGPDHDPRHPYWFGWDKNFDYLLWMRSDQRSLTGIVGLERLAAGEVFELYRIVRRERPGAL